MNPAVAEIPLVYHPADADEVLEFTARAAVRLAMILDRQTQAARDRIRRAIVEGAARFQRNGRIRIAMPAALASATWP